MFRLQLHWRLKKFWLKSFKRFAVILCAQQIAWKVSKQILMSRSFATCLATSTAKLSSPFPVGKPAQNCPIILLIFANSSFCYWFREWWCLFSILILLICNIAKSFFIQRSFLPSSSKFQSEIETFGVQLIGDSSGREPTMLPNTDIPVTISIARGELKTILSFFKAKLVSLIKRI